MSFHTCFILVLAFLTFVVGPIWMVREFVRGLRTKASERKGGGGGVSNAVAGAMQELDRILTRPSIEHTIETETSIEEKESEPNDGE